MIYHVSRPDGTIVNALVWFGNSELDGCTHALVLQSGDLVLLKTEKIYNSSERKEFGYGHGEQYAAWCTEFGTGYASELLRAGLREAAKLHKGDQ